MTCAVDWIFISGGICSYGDERKPRHVLDLWWSKTPVTLEQASCPCSEDNADHPVTRITFDEAVGLAAYLGGRLPMSFEWEWAATGGTERKFPWGDSPWNERLANLRTSRLGAPTPVRRYAYGSTPEGLLDMAGNVWGGTATTLPQRGAIIRGGSYNSTPLHATTKFVNAAPIELRSCGIGLRIVRLA